MQLLAVRAHCASPFSQRAVGILSHAAAFYCA